jgi:4-hydroxybenzoyl-CoA thioesterase/acyl-CoA thioester hydrolase
MDWGQKERESMAQIHRTQYRVQFRDTDAAGIMHFSTFFTYMEETEHDFLRAQGLSVVLEHEGRTLSWPRVSATCDFSGALRFENEFEVSLSVIRLGEKSVTYQMVFEHAGCVVAKGQVVAVCCEIEHGKNPVSVAIPERVRQAILPYLHQASA